MCFRVTTRPELPTSIPFRHVTFIPFHSTSFRHFVTATTLAVCAGKWSRTLDRKIAEDFGLTWRLSRITKLRIQISYLNPTVVKYLVAVLREMII